MLRSLARTGFLSASPSRVLQLQSSGRIAAAKAFSSTSLLQQQSGNEDSKPDTNNDRPATFSYSSPFPSGPEAKNAETAPSSAQTFSGLSSSSSPSTEMKRKQSSNAAADTTSSNDDIPAAWLSIVETLGTQNDRPHPDVPISMMPASEPLDPETMFEQLWSNRERRGPRKPAKPSDGRVCDIDRDNDVARGYGLLNSILGRNQVRHELRLGERFEKPNQMRRRLKSERHRRRFAQAVRQKVQLVMELKSRGA